MKASAAALVLLCVLGMGSYARQGDDLGMRSELAKQAMAVGQFARAADIYAALIKELPGNPGLLLNLGMALYYQGKYSEAVQQFKAALQLKPELAPANFFLGVSYAKLHLGLPAADTE